MNETIQALDWPSNGLELLGACPACGSNSRRIEFQQLKDELYDAPGRWTLYKCLDCHAGYLDPRPSIETIDLAYSNYYTHVSTGENAEKLFALVKLLVRNGYLNSAWHMSLHPAAPLVARGLVNILPGLKAFFDRHVMRDLPLYSGGTLLDIGCGNGEFLRLAQAAGWSVQGIDTDSRAIDAAKVHGVEVKKGGIELLAEERERFDLITMNHVIEHVHDPVGLLRACLRLLKKNGTLWLESPNFNSYGRRLFGKHWRGLEVPRHLVVFDTAHMAKLLSKVGFRTVRHAEWMPQHKWMYQASKNIKNGMPATERNLSGIERLKISFADRKLRADINSRECFTFICTK